MSLLDALTDVLIVLPLTGLIATFYLVSVWSIRPRSIVLGLLALGASLAEAVALFIGPLALRSALGLPQPPEVRPLVALAIVVCIAIPHVYAVGVFVLRRRASA